VQNDQEMRNFNSQIQVYAIKINHGTQTERSTI